MDQPKSYVVMVSEKDLNSAILWAEQLTPHFFWQFGYRYNKIRFVFWAEDIQILFALKWA